MDIWPHFVEPLRRWDQPFVVLFISHALFSVILIDPTEQCIHSICRRLIGPLNRFNNKVDAMVELTTRLIGWCRPTPFDHGYLTTFYRADEEVVRSWHFTKFCRAFEEVRSTICSALHLSCVASTSRVPPVTDPTAHYMHGICRCPIGSMNFWQQGRCYGSVDNEA